MRASLSSQPITSAPPANSALALARPEAPSPNTATLRPAKDVTGIIGEFPPRGSIVPSPLVGESWGGRWPLAHASVATPLPDPPLQGGRKRVAPAATKSNPSASPQLQ